MAGRTSSSTHHEPKLRFGEAEIVRMGLGTNRLSNTPANVAFVEEAVAAGVGMIDTAHSYTRGESEETIGAALSANPDRVLVGTKGGIGGPGHGRPEVLHAEIEESLRRLRMDRIPLYYLHRVDPETPLEESLAAIKQYRDRGKIQHVGISEVSIDEIERARRVVPIAAVQNHYNVAERKHETVVDYCAREDIVFVPFFPLRGAGGTAVDEIAARHEVTPAQIELAWLLRRSPTILPIPGTLSPEHLKENLAALQIELTDAEFEALRLSSAAPR
jgi:aryl-alcohol dehydrogenase-like predicted oxidoreductase